MRPRSWLIYIVAPYLSSVPGQGQVQAQAQVHPRILLHGHILEGAGRLDILPDLRPESDPAGRPA